jgi:hypothetical protein
MCARFSQVRFDRGFLTPLISAAGHPSSSSVVYPPIPGSNLTEHSEGIANLLFRPSYRDQRRPANLDDHRPLGTGVIKSASHILGESGRKGDNLVGSLQCLGSIFPFE